ncbi:hypothetical protein [Ferrimicrobium acidiphilum]|uniref:hypothetical protein n=1 Tax=Ferrimicrobium acidiphilum TaxID=121039 RepID=UPI0023EF59D1|nr:hypothetical protein [Ferrimicrobium acidiphilum]
MTVQLGREENRCRLRISFARFSSAFSRSSWRTRSLAGLVVLGLELLLSGKKSREIGRAIVSAPLPFRLASGVALASVLATFINPHGMELLAYDFKVATSGQLSSIMEWQSPNFHSITMLALVVGPVAFVMWVLLFGRSKFELLDLVFLGGTLLATLHAMRFVPIEGIAFCALASRLPVLRIGDARRSWTTWPVAVVLLTVVLSLPHPPAGTPSVSGIASQPVTSSAWLKRHVGSERVFSTYMWNDYLIHLGIPVFVDGRTDLYFGTGVLAKYIAVSTLTTNPEPVFQRWNVQWVMWPPKSPLSIFLLQSHQWRVVHRTANAVIFERRTTTVGEVRVLAHMCPLAP